MDQPERQTQTRKLVIKDKVFKAEDLRKIANIFERQNIPRGESPNAPSRSYEIKFLDNSTLESNSPLLFSDESLATPGRPVAVRMSFKNYASGRYLQFSVNHGNSMYGNEAEVSGNDLEWVGATFLKLKESLDVVAPQYFWLRQHKTVFLSLLALGMGSLVQLLIDFAVINFLIVRIPAGIIKPLPLNSPWRKILPSQFVMTLGGWVWRWILGLAWGAPFVREWVLSAWPSVEFDFGPDHLRTEKAQRKRLSVAMALIVLPIVGSLIADLIWKMF